MRTAAGLRLGAPRWCPPWIQNRGASVPPRWCGREAVYSPACKQFAHPRDDRAAVLLCRRYVEVRVRDDVLDAVLVRLAERDVVAPSESVSTELTEEAPAEIVDIRWEFAGLEEAVVYFLRPFASAFAEMLVAVERVREDADVLPGAVDRGNVFQAEGLSFQGQSFCVEVELISASRGTSGCMDSSDCIRLPGIRTPNADDRLPLASFGRAEGGDSIVEGRDVADVRPQSSVPYPLDDLAQLGTIGLDHEVDCQAVGGPPLGRPYDGHQCSSGPDQACGPLLDVSADDVEHQVDAADVFQRIVVEVDELGRAEVERLLAVGSAPGADDVGAELTCELRHHRPD
jgi:hypothetical protein